MSANDEAVLGQFAILSEPKEFEQLVPILTGVEPDIGAVYGVRRGAESRFIPELDVGLYPAAKSDWFYFKDDAGW